MADWLTGWMGNYSVRRRVLVATIATRQEFPEKWTGFWIVSSCQPQAHVSEQLPNFFQGRLHHTFRLPLFQPSQNNLSLHRQSQVR